MKKFCLIISVIVFVLAGMTAVFADDFSCLTPYGNMEGNTSGISVGSNAAVVIEKGATVKSERGNHFYKLFARYKA